MPNRILALAAFLSTAFLTWFFTAHLLSPSLDEGIYLNGAHRILQGQVPYRDFFAFTGPILYWTGALAEWLGGPAIPNLRIVTATAIGFTAVGIFYLAKRLGGQPAAITGTLFWFAITIDLWHRLELNHRWLSGGLMSLAGVLLFCAPRPSRVQFGAAGALIALAAWTTPSFAIAIVILFLYFLISSRTAALDFTIGVAIAGVIPVAVLGMQGALIPFFENLMWASSNYSTANKFSFGYTFSQIPLRYQLHVYSSVGIVPVVFALLLGLRVWRKDQELDLPLAYTAAFFMTSYPKWDANQLLFVNAAFIACAAGLFFRYLPARLEPIATGLISVPCAFVILNLWGLSGMQMPYASRTGTLYGIAPNVSAMERIESVIPAGATVFVYPYMTELYPLLRVTNPTRYEYLQPGMMNDADEQKELDDLNRRPPQFIYWHALPDIEVLKIWPNTDPARLHFKAIEKWIEANYNPGLEIPDSQFLGRVWTRKQ